MASSDEGELHVALWFRVAPAGAPGRPLSLEDNSRKRSKEALPGVQEE